MQSLAKCRGIPRVIGLRSSSAKAPPLSVRQCQNGATDSSGGSSLPSPIDRPRAQPPASQGILIRTASPEFKSRKRRWTVLHKRSPACGAIITRPISGPVGDDPDLTGTHLLKEEELERELQIGWEALFAQAGDFLGPIWKNYFLLFTISAGVIFGLIWPDPGRYAQSTLQLTTFCTFCIFFISGLALDVRELRQVAAAWPAFVFGLASSLFMTPWVCPLITKLPIQPVELTTGLALFCTMPSTINVGISLARAADANVTMALAITVVTNMAGIVTIPFFVSHFLPTQDGFTLPCATLFTGLVTTLLVPLGAGMVTRACFPPLAHFVDKHKQAFSMTNNLLLSMVPWMQVSNARATILQLRPDQILPIALAGLAAHTLFLGFNIGALKVLRTGGWSGILGKREADAIDRSVILLASQKTLPVAAAVVQKLGDSLGVPALILLPCVLTHFLQIFMDTFIVSQWVKSDKEWQEEQDRLAEQDMLAEQDRLAAKALQPAEAEPETLKT